MGASCDITEQILTNISPLPVFPTQHKATVWPLKAKIEKSQERERLEHQSIRGLNSKVVGSTPAQAIQVFYFCKKDSALVLKLPGEMPIQSQRTLSFSATQEVSKTLIKNQMKNQNFGHFLTLCTFQKNYLLYIIYKLQFLFHEFFL